MSNNMERQSASPSLKELLEFTETYTNRVEQLAREQAAQKLYPEKELVLWTAIAGIQFHVKRETEEGAALLNSLTPGTELRLRREPDNKYDHWAIIVETVDGKMLGYVTRYKNETIARMMDYGHVFEARIESIDDPNTEEAQSRGTTTEQYILPFSIWLVS
jgi:hypothetical protein